VLTYAGYGSGIPNLLSRGGSIGWVPGTAETNRLFVALSKFDLAWQRETKHKHAFRVEAECGK